MRHTRTTTRRRRCFMCGRRRDLGASSSDEADEFRRLDRNAVGHLPIPARGQATPSRKKPSAVSLLGIWGLKQEATDASDGTLDVAPQFSAREYLDHYEPTEYTNTVVYSNLRRNDIDVDEKFNWSPSTVQTVVEESPEDISMSLRIAIRRGVPDALKSYLLRKAYGAARYLKANPAFVDNTYHGVFGSKIPQFVEGHVPTFSGGFLGTEEELHGAPLPSERWELLLEGGQAPLLLHHIAGHQMRPSLVSGSSSMEKLRMNGFSAKQRPSRPRSPTTDLAYHGLMFQRRADSPWEQRPEAGVSRHLSALGAYTPPLASRQSLTAHTPNAKRELSHTLSHEQREKEQLRSTNQDYKQRTSLVGSRRALIASGSIAWDISQPESRPAKNQVVGNTALTTASSGYLGAVYTLTTATTWSQLLTRDGQFVAKKVLWTLSARYPHLDFAPLLAPLTCVLLLYISEQEALTLLIKMLNKADELLRCNASRPFLTFRRSEFVRFVKVAMAFCQKSFPHLTSHLNALRVDLAAWFARGLQDGFARLFSLDLLLRVYIPFIFEGTKIFIRYALALLKLAESDLLEATTAEEANLILLFRTYRDASPDEINDLTKLAFRFQVRASHEPMGKYTSHDIPTPYLTRTRMQKFYRPRLDHESSIIPGEMWSTIWRWLPHEMRILDPELAFDSATAGHSLQAIQRVLWQEQDRPMVFFIATSDRQVLGGFCPFTFRGDPPFLCDLSGAFVCCLRPHEAYFRWTGKTTTIMKFSKEILAFGSESPAIMIDSDLHRGHSEASRAFDSPRLVDSEFGDFSVVRMEIWLMA